MSTPSAPTTRARVGWLSPRLWGLHALVVVAVTFTVFMGLWQMGVYDDRRAEAEADQTTASVVPLQDVLGPDEPFTTTAASRTVALTGTFAPAERQVWVSGREQSGRDGYWLLAPILVDEVAGASDRPAALLVVRGWSPDAGALPPVPEGDVALEVVLQPGDARGTGFDEETRVIDGVRIPRLVNVVPYDLYGGYGIVTAQTPADGAGLAPAEVPEQTQDGTAGLRNLLYAIEWWIFGAFALFMWWRMCLDLRREGGVVQARVPAAKRAAQEAARARARARDDERSSALR
ncbi:hypothetical protein KV100_09785 [Mumia sp. zg.B21]|uniref:SURF1 family protein n=1 Tax=Mumia sp. zg.B21 TaxID=2855447 RepID=UPI001C6EEFB9|nr:SURF1 family cytochrome oxidase biogenesis protein [Mumia sp. zg.B21]MBW9209950.1 hypothetical protein [Mumia sp. zg.B21]